MNDGDGVRTGSPAGPIQERPARGRALRERGLGFTFLALLILVVMLFPLYWMINVSLQRSGSAVGTPWFPWDLSFQGYSKALSEQGHNLLVSLQIAGGTVLFSLLIAAPGAYALAHFKVRGSGVVLLGVLISQMVPGIAVANALYTAFNDLGLLDSIWGLILADSTYGIPFALLIVRAFMLAIPSEIIEAAYVDGAGPIRSFVSVVLPLSRNALISAGLFTFLFAWGDFLFALTLTTSPNVRPVTLGLYTYVGAFVQDWSTVMATAVLASVPAVLILAWAQRFITAGTTAGAGK